MKVKNLESPRTGKAVANQFSITHGMERWFQSYDSVCAKLTWKSGECKLVFGRDWDYSVTTLKYLRVWLYDNYYFEYSRMSKKELQEQIDKGNILYDENL